MIKYLFVDRDGTIIIDKHYLSNPAEIELIPHVATALQALQQKNIQLFLVTNQSGIGRGYFKKEALFACNKELEKQLAPYNINFVDMAYCPHAPEDNCSCRKPKLGMWEYLQKKYNIDPSQCAMIGDKKEDVLFGINANFAYSCLVQTGKGQKTADSLSFSFDTDFFPIQSTLFGQEKTNTLCYGAKQLINFADFLINNIQ